MTGLCVLQLNLWKAMRIIILLILVGIFKVHASSYAQKITLHEQNSSLVEVLEKISAQSGYDIVYGNTTLTNAKRISLKLNNKEVSEALKEVFKGQKINYT